MLTRSFIMRPSLADNSFETPGLPPHVTGGSAVPSAPPDTIPYSLHYASWHGCQHNTLAAVETWCYLYAVLYVQPFLFHCFTVTHLNKWGVLKSFPAGGFVGDLGRNCDIRRCPRCLSAGFLLPPGSFPGMPPAPGE